MRIAIIGAGSIGSLVASYLHAGGQELVLYELPGQRAELLRKHGLRVSGVYGDFSASLPVMTEPQTDKPFDALFVCVKAYQSDAAARRHAVLFGDALVVSLQNGIGNVEAIRNAAPTAHVAAATTTMGAYPEPDGTIRHAGVGDTLIGPFDAGDAGRVATLAEALTGPQLKFTYSDDIRRVLFTKLAVNCVLNPPTALLRITNGGVGQSPELVALGRDIVAELVAVAAAQGVELEADALLERALEVSRLTAENQNSMYKDVAAGQRTEIDAINGAIARMGADLGVPTPVNATLAHLVRALGETACIS